MCRSLVRPQIPGLSPGGLGPHRTSSGSPGGLSSGFPFARRVLPLPPPSSGFPSSGVLRLGPFGRCPVPVPLRFPSGGPFPLSDPHGSAAARRFRRHWSRAAGTKVTSNAAPPRSIAIRPHSRWAAAEHDGMPPQNRLLRAVASAGHAPEPPRLGGYFAFRNLAVIAVGDRRLDSLLCLPGDKAGLVREASRAGSVWSARGIFAERRPTVRTGTALCGPRAGNTVSARARGRACGITALGGKPCWRGPAGRGAGRRRNGYAAARIHRGPSGGVPSHAGRL
jgi:hypothetical protein